jgi:hypothetical protein
MTKELLDLKGRFEFVCRDRDGVELWRETIDNVVCTLGKNQLFDAALRGAAYTVVGPFMGLISSVSFTAVAAADTMASHAGWLEAGSTNAPTFSGTRGSAAFAAASAGASAITPLVFTFTGAGTVQGAFMCFGTGAVATLMSTAGVLLSAGTFGTPQPVVSTNTLTVSYSISG